MSSGAFDLESRELDGIGVGVSLGAPEDGSGTMDEEHSDVGISSLADGPEPASQARRVFPRSESEV